MKNDPYLEPCFCFDGLGPAPEAVTNAIFEMTKSLSSYKICPDLKVDFSSVGTKQFQVDGKQFTVEVVDTVADYVQYMKEIFDFASIKSLLGGAGGFNILLDAMNGGIIHLR